MKRLLIAASLLLSACAAPGPPRTSADSQVAQTEYRAALVNLKRCATDAADGYANQPDPANQVANAALGKCIHEASVAKLSGERMAMAEAPSSNPMLQNVLMTQTDQANAKAWVDLKTFLIARVMDDRAALNHN